MPTRRINVREHPRELKSGKIVPVRKHPREIKKKNKFVYLSESIKKQVDEQKRKEERIKIEETEETKKEEWIIDVPPTGGKWSKFYYKEVSEKGEFLKNTKIPYKGDVNLWDIGDQGYIVVQGLKDNNFWRMEMGTYNEYHNDFSEDYPVSKHTRVGKVKSQTHERGKGYIEMETLEYTPSNRVKKHQIINGESWRYSIRAGSYPEAKLLQRQVIEYSGKREEKKYKHAVYHYTVDKSIIVKEKGGKGGFVVFIQIGELADDSGGK